MLARPKMSRIEWKKIEIGAWQSWKFHMSLQSWKCLTRFLPRQSRSNRVAILATAYPPIHFVVLSALASSIVLAFLLETDQEVLRFLDALQLRLLFTILIGVFSALAALVVDLADPFRGAYRITPTVAQLFPLRAAFDYDVCSKQGDLDDARSRGGESDHDAAAARVLDRQHRPRCY